LSEILLDMMRVFADRDILRREILLLLHWRWTVVANAILTWLTILEPLYHKQFCLLFLFFRVLMIPLWKF